MMDIRIEGLSQALGRISSLDSRTGNAFERGLKKAGLLVQRESMKEVPVDEGNLRASAFTRNMGGSGFDADIHVGYTADYAIYVHEDMDALHGEAFNEAYADLISRGIEHNRGPNQKAKFLEDPVKRNFKKIVDLVTDEVLNALRKMK